MQWSINIYIVVPAQVGVGAAKMGAAQWFRLANLARIFINLSWYQYTLIKTWIF